MLTACAAADAVDGVDPEQAIESIVGGTETTAYPAVVGLVAFKPGETSGSLCTATLITPTLLLTAAHCVDPAVVGEGMVFEARFANNIRQTPAGMTIPVKEVHWDTAFDKNNLPGGHDIAVAILEKPAPDGIKPLPWLKTAIPQDLVGGNIHVVGFGLNNGFDQEGTSAGTKREANIAFSAMTNLVLTVGKAGLNICNGDSGGPGLAKINGVETVIGVNSYGVIFCIGQSAQTNVPTYAAFVKKYADATSCTPLCGGKACGTDACGGDCGKCDTETECNSNGECVPASDPPGGPAGCPNENEGNDDAPQANDICSDNTILGTIKADNDDDWYVFDIKPGTTYSVLLDNVSDKYTMSLYKKSTKTGNLAFVGDAGLAGPNRIISRRTSDGGLYYVKISGKGVSATNQYGLFIR
jgi:V8-like Glu-specific endopeptidase